MYRAIFFAVGAMLIIVGLEAMLIDSATIYSAAESSGPEFAEFARSGIKTKVVKPGEWTPWVILSFGTIVVLWAYTLPQRWHRPAAS